MWYEHTIVRTVGAIPDSTTNDTPRSCRLSSAGSTMRQVSTAHSPHTLGRSTHTTSSARRKHHTLGQYRTCRSKGIAGTLPQLASHHTIGQYRLQRVAVAAYARSVLHTAYRAVSPPSTYYSYNALWQYHTQYIAPYTRSVPSTAYHFHARKKQQKKKKRN
eukprot:1602105-Rhodomonas_salina.2